MASDSQQAEPPGVLTALRKFARDLIAFAGWSGVRAILYMALGAIFESVGIVLIIPLLAALSGQTGNSWLERTVTGTLSGLGVASLTGRLAILLSTFVLLIVLRGVVMLRRDVATQSLQMMFVEDLRERAMRRLAAAGWEHLLRLRHARITHLMSGDVQRIGVAVHFFLQGVVSVVLLALQCALAFWLAPRLALLAFGLLLIGGFAMVPMLRRARSLGDAMTGANLALLDSISQFLSGIKLAISQDRQEAFIDEFHNSLASLRDRQIHYFVQQAGARVLVSSLAALVAAVAVFVGYGVYGIAMPVLIAFLVIVGRMIGPATLIQQGLQQVAFGLAAYENTTALLDELRPAPASRAVAPPSSVGGVIALENVTFRHAGGEGQQGVGGVTLRIAPSTFVGIAGASGAGKTTLLDLIVGLLRPQAGRITIGGVALDEATLPAWRAQLSYITQDPFLFHESIRRNLLWADPQASEATLWDALAMAGADAIVRAMPEGLDTVVGERGSLVSGGERQRIALARALLRKPRLLVMDEATNAIDIRAEGVLLDRLRAITPAMTIIIVAHRQESLAHCDRVIQLDGGGLEPVAIGVAASGA